MPRFRRPPRRPVVVSAYDGPPFDCECPICQWLMEQQTLQREISPGVYASELSEEQMEEYVRRFGGGVFRKEPDD